MKTAGIICEYNPFHNGHARHIEETKVALGGDAFIVCVMSGNYVQRGDFAVFGKHARAKMAVQCGADLVIELPAAYALQSAGDFALSGVRLLDALGVCDCLSFGSESGSIEELQRAAQAISSVDAQEHIREALGRGLPYAKAQQAAADALLMRRSGVFKSPNNTLGIEYLRALDETGRGMRPITILRKGGDHDSPDGCSASALRKSLAAGVLLEEYMPVAAALICTQEITCYRGPVLMKDMQQAMLSRLRTAINYGDIAGGSDGLDFRFSRIAGKAPTVPSLLEQVKTKRFAMSRIRRVMFCAVLGITKEIAKTPPPYLRVLAMNRRGMQILKTAAKNAAVPIVTKPASVRELGAEAVKMFEVEASTADFYALAYRNERERTGGGDWRRSPVIENWQ